jgi:AhpD family alkylhydroperoxidase
MPITPPAAYDSLDPAAKLVWDHIKAQQDGKEPWVELRMMARSPGVMRDTYDAATLVAAEYEDGPLDEKQVEAIRLGVSSANNCGKCVQSHAAKCRKLGWSDEEVSDILGLTAVCTMLNAYHRHRDLVGDASELPVDSGLPHGSIAEPDRLDPMLVELICMAVSSVMACPKCTRHHRQKARELGATDDHLAQAVRATAVMTLYNTFFRTQ